MAITHTKNIYNHPKLSVLEDIIDNIPHYIFWKDANHKFLGCNKNFAAEFGFDDPKKMLGKTDSDFVWLGGLSQKYIEDDKEVMRTGIAKLNYEEEQTRPDGSLKIVLVSKVPLYDESNKISGILGIYLDITERKQFEQALLKAKEKAEAASKAKTEFLMNMRHDVRTPLTGIIGFANLIRDESKNPKIAEYVDNMLASSHALLDFLNEVLETVRVTSGEIPVVKKKFDLKQKIQSLIALNQTKADEKALKLSFDYDAKIPRYLLGDSTRIHRIILELITNALNFTHKGEVKIHVVLAKREKNNVIVKVMVSDSGIGIPADKKEEIFVRFKRLTSSYEGIYKGVGLGLTIVKQFIDDLEGELYVDSELDKGSTFTCLFPLKEALLDDASGLEPEPEIKSSPSTRKSSAVKSKPLPSTNKKELRILLVEDQAIAAMAARAMLEELNCHVDVAENGHTAILKSKAKEYDLIFMDIGLPDTNGCDVTKEIRLWETSTEKHVPIIALTAHVEEENKQQCIEAGMEAVLSKPLLKNTAIDILNAFIPKAAGIQKANATKLIKPSSSDYQVTEVSGDIVNLALAMQATRSDEKFAKQMLSMLVNSFPEELSKLTDAYKKSDWQTIREVAHKMKGGSSYCGTPRLKIACANLEGYLKSPENIELREPLYQQVLQEIDAVNNSAKTVL